MCGTYARVVQNDSRERAQTDAEQVNGIEADEPRHGKPLQAEGLPQTGFIGKCNNETTQAEEKVDSEIGTMATVEMKISRGMPEDNQYGRQSAHAIKEVEPVTTRRDRM